MIPLGDDLEILPLAGLNVAEEILCSTENVIEFRASGSGGKGLKFTDYTKELLTVCIDTFTDFKERIHNKNVQVFAINKSPGWDSRALVRIFRLLRKLKPDIVHTRNLAALDALLGAGGRMPWATFARRFGEVREMGVG